MGDRRTYALVNPCWYRALSNRPPPRRGEGLRTEKDSLEDIHSCLSNSRPNFINYDNDDRYYVYVYAHTRREILKLVDEINTLAQRAHQGGETGITIVSPDYWPLPWYVRDYKRVGYYGHMTPSTEPIIIAKQNQAAEVQATFGDGYQQIRSGFNGAGSFPLRPGVDLLLYTRRELVH